MSGLTLDGSYNARAIGAHDAPWLVRTAALDDLTATGELTLRVQGVDLVLDLREPAERGEHRHWLPVRSIALYGETPPRAGRLEDVYRGLLRDRAEALTAAVVAIAEHPGTVAVHCTAGKDRTGLVVALTRLAAGEPLDAVATDYAASGAAVRPVRRRLVAALLTTMCLSGSERADAERLHLDSPAEALVAAVDVVDAFGGVHAYLLAHGARTSHLESLAARAA